MGKLAARITTFIKDESAITAVEYGLIAGFIAAALVVAVAYVAGALDTNLSAVASLFPSAP